MNIIETKFYKDAIEIIEMRIKKNISTLIYGETGSGKTTLMSRVNYRKLGKRRVIWCSLYNVVQSVAEILDHLQPDMNYSYSPMKLSRNINDLCSYDDIVITIDEGQHIREKVWPYIKGIMDVGVPFIFAGTEKMYQTVRTKHPDILSRTKDIGTVKIGEDDVLSKYGDLFHPDAMSLIYGMCDVNARYLFEYIEDLVEYSRTDPKFEGKMNFDYVSEVLGEIDKGICNKRLYKKAEDKKQKNRNKNKEA